MAPTAVMRATRPATVAIFILKALECDFCLVRESNGRIGAVNLIAWVWKC